jgi:hypothetical protein
MKLKQLLETSKNPMIISEDIQQVSAGVASGEYVITTQNVPVSSVLFIPKLKTKQQLDSMNTEQVLDELMAFCESKTGLKFSVNYKYQGVGYAFTVDSYSIVEKLKH